MLLRRLLGYCLRKIQGTHLYRKVAKVLRQGIIVTEATEEDMERVHHWFNPEREVKVIPNPNVTNFVAKKGEKITGFVQLVTYPNNTLYPGWWLFSLSVKTLYRGMGIGEGLAKAVIEKAKVYGAKELSLLVREDNNRAINLNKKLGFKRNISLELEEKLKQEAVKTGRRRIIMSKDLS